MMRTSGIFAKAVTQLFTRKHNAYLDCLKTGHVKYKFKSVDVAADKTTETYYAFHCEHCGTEEAMKREVWDHNFQAAALWRRGVNEAERRAEQAKKNKVLDEAFRSPPKDPVAETLVEWRKEHVEK